MGYYTVNLVLNVAFLAFYTVMVVSSHHPCLTSSGMNITDSFTMAFMIGLFVLSGDFINSNVIQILFRSKKQHEMDTYGLITRFTLKINETSEYFEWGYRLIIVLISLLQFNVVHSDHGYYCAQQLGVLSVEAQWLNIIIACQVAKVILFSYW